MAVQQQVTVIFFLLEVGWVETRSPWLRFGSKWCFWTLGYHSVILPMICLHKWFQSDVCELRFFFRFRLRTRQSEHLCKVCVSLTTIQVFKHLLKVPLTVFFVVFFEWIQIKAALLGQCSFIRYSALLKIFFTVCWLPLLFLYLWPTFYIIWVKKWFLKPLSFIFYF